MKLAIAQMQMDIDKKKNEQRALGLAHSASTAKADLLLYPELTLTPFFPKYPSKMLEGMGIPRDAFSIEANDQILTRFAEQARKDSIYLCPNFYVKEEDGRLFDRSYFFEKSGRLVGKSDMHHIFTAENFFEGDYYTPAEEPFKVFPTPYGNIGVVICFDRHIPETIRACALAGAEIVLIPSANLKSEPLDVFKAEIVAEAYQNNVFIAMANRVGNEDGLVFAGNSLVVGPDGRVLAEGGAEEGLIFCYIDTGAAVRERKTRPYIGYCIPDSGVYNFESEELSIEKEPSVEDVYMAMADYDEGDAKRIQHFTKVYYYAHLISVGEHLPLKTRQITEIAAMVHDIGIHKAEQHFHTTAGKYQEKLGAPEAAKLLTHMGFPEQVVNRVSFLVGHHHTYTNIDGIDYQILVEADFLVNIYEDQMDLKARENAFEKIFKTETGKRLFRQMYPEE
ncbi:MAG: hypothetical protein DUD27_07530 [Lachnospiraceae bacterium]|uniref:CN hydrolase domain-containing protein n=1 Tax=Candidatus Weimeria bifida TaxID=2599074 RepID=A0A6N7IWM6_9FIRM|nr:hypothetical protein [Candidatus Weimeria bifida]RRF95688.1 MAG: hypothetical protein DUD27_07530 [Lachnospiraceae bacterium]